ncbi:DUF155 domain-containing protein, partial [Haematococcus lacustris]
MVDAFISTWSLPRLVQLVAYVAAVHAGVVPTSGVGPSTHSGGQEQLTVSVYYDTNYALVKLYFRLTDLYRQVTGEKEPFKELMASNHTALMLQFREVLMKDCKTFGWEKINNVLVKNWDLGNLETVSRVVGQSVALDYYHSTVDDQSCLVERLVERIGDRHSMELLSSWREALPVHATSRMLVALLCDLIQFHATVTKKLGMLDKDHTPWESDKHEQVWQSLRRYYDIDKRDHALLTKLEAVRQRV